MMCYSKVSETKQMCTYFVYVYTFFLCFMSKPYYPKHIKYSLIKLVKY